jgi:23S rRNA (cytidine1920-2'-O)/16S rRNA (cytidine1409-2'-O)-methyltransferase
MRVPTAAKITIKQKPRYVSRGGIKMEAALQAFKIDVHGLIAADIGASTGGFTDCLLQHGATRVYAIDVGYGQLAWRLRRNPRVVVMERVNARYLHELPELVDLATVDVSFISLRLVLPAVVRVLTSSGQIIALIKPQFEAGRKQVGRGGVVKDPAVHRMVLHNVLTWAQSHAGNVEFLAHLTPGPGRSRTSLDEIINDCITSLLLVS